MCNSAPPCVACSSAFGVERDSARKSIAYNSNTLNTFPCTRKTKTSSGSPEHSECHVCRYPPTRGRDHETTPAHSVPPRAPPRRDTRTSQMVISESLVGATLLMRSRHPLDQLGHMPECVVGHTLRRAFPTRPAHCEHLCIPQHVDAVYTNTQSRNNNVGGVCCTRNRCVKSTLLAL